MTDAARIPGGTGAVRNAASSSITTYSPTPPVERRRRPTSKFGAGRTTHTRRPSSSSRRASTWWKSQPLDWRLLKRRCLHRSYPRLCAWLTPLQILKVRRPQWPDDDGHSRWMALPAAPVRRSMAFSCGFYEMALTGASGYVNVDAPSNAFYEDWICGPES